MSARDVLYVLNLATRTRSDENCHDRLNIAEHHFFAIIAIDTNVNNDTSNSCFRRSDTFSFVASLLWNPQTGTYILLK